MNPSVLVMTTVHWPDDTRIRERLIRTLAPDFSVAFAARSPGPTDKSDHDFLELVGGRLRRNLTALALSLRRKWDVLVVHDPELIPTALIARLAKRKPVVFDVHEDYVAVAATRDWVFSWLRTPLRVVARLALWASEMFLDLTLAEGQYTKLFRSRHPVFPNFPNTSHYPAVQKTGNGEAIYLGDATVARGVDLAIEACALAHMPLRIIGRIAPEIEEKVAASSGPGAEVVLEGRLSNPEAIEMVARASVGLVPLRDLPNYRHSQPTKLLEYLALGVPVVASDLPGTRQLADALDGVLFFDPGAVSAMADALIRASGDDWKEVAAAQANHIRESFRWPAAEVLDFYRGLVSR